MTYRLCSIAASWLLAAVLMTPGLRAQTLVRAPDASAPLAERWAWAQDEADARDLSASYWIGYTVQRRDDGSTTVWRDDRDGRRTRLNALLDNATGDASGTESDQVRAILFELDARSGAVDDLTVTDMDRRVHLGDRTVFWLGPAGDAESIALIRTRYDEAGDEDAREHLVTATGVHDAPAEAVPFLREVLRGPDDEEVRNKAAFWLGQQGGSEALGALREAARSDRSAEVRKQAVFGISRMDGEAAMDALIALARGADDPDVRGKAIFWLGQSASEKAASVLEGVAYDEEETEVQEQAVFALSRLDDGAGVPRLVEIAKTHANPEVREKAIFWLGQSGDDRAVDALVQIVRGQE